MAQTGVKVKALESYPELCEVQLFYLEMYHICGTNFSNIMDYSRLFGLGNVEILEAVRILNSIAVGLE